MKFPNKFIFWLPIMVLPIILMGVETAAAAGFREYETPPCYDVTGSSQPLLVGGVNNSGILDFDDAGVPGQYQACVRVDKYGVDAKPVRLEGWVWNDNLGWISLYCPGGAGAKNLDIPCGGLPYEIDFATTGPDGNGNFATVDMDGYAWGDNIGWISFKSAFHRMSPVPANPNRGLVSPGLSAAARDAWADTIGWMDFGGVWFHWDDTDPPVVDPNIIKYIDICSVRDIKPTPVTPYDTGTSYDSYGNVPTSISTYGSNLWVVNASTRNLVKFNISTGVPNPVKTFTSIDVNEKSPYFVDSESSGYKTYMISYSLGGNLGIVAFDESTGNKAWSQQVTWPGAVLPVKFHDMYADGTNAAAWVLASDVNGAHLLKYRRTDGFVTILDFPAGVTVNQVVYAPNTALTWVLQGDNKLVKVSSSNLFAGTGGLYTNSIVNIPEIGTGVAAPELQYDNMNGAIWMGLASSNELIKLRSSMGTLSFWAKYSAPVAGLSHFNFDYFKRAIWSVGSSAGVGRTDTQTGVNMGLYPDLAAINPTAVVSDRYRNVIWTTQSVAPGKIWKTSRETVTAFSPGESKCACDLDGTCPVITDSLKAPFADGVETNEVDVRFVDGGVKIPDTDIDECSSASLNMYTTAPGTKKYCAKMNYVWEDDVDLDQTTLASQQQDIYRYGSTNGGAIKKPLLYGLYGLSDFKYDPVTQSWKGPITSVAPTSDMNTTGGTQNEKFYYWNKADVGTYDVTKSNQNLLKVKEIDLMFFQYSTGPGIPAKCIYGKVNVDKCEMYNISTASSTISFNPLVKADTLDYLSYGNPLNFIALDSVDTPQQFKMDKLVFNPSAIAPAMTFRIGLEDSSLYQLKLLTDKGFPKATPPDPADATIVDQMVKSNATTDTWIGQLFATGLSSTLTQAGPYLHSKVTYRVGGQAVSYWGPKLPRIKAGVIVNPVAKVEGNVYMTDFAQKSADVSLKSLGNISSNLRREAIVRNVAKYLTGYTTPLVGVDRTVSNPMSITGLNELVKTKVYYLKDHNLTIDCGAVPPPAVSTCTFRSNVTFIVENGSIIVNSNINTLNNAQVGLIALRDLEGNKQNQGFLYLNKNVTWLSNTQIYLDRVMQSYDKSMGLPVTNADGFAMYADDDNARQQRFGSQLVIEGTLSSMNGIGNASRLPPTDENGRVLTGTTYCTNYANVTGICRARLVDLNYLRYYGPGLEICSNGTAKDQKRATEPDGGCDASVVGYDIDATDLYNATTNPDKDLVAGKLAPNSVRSTYFVTKNLPVILENEYPVNFFYRPIAKDLPGFEVEQDFSPVVR